MKNFKLIMLFCIGALFIASKSFGQANPFINVLPSNSGIVSVGATIDIIVTIGNTGPVSTVAQGKLRPLIQVPASVTFLPSAQQVGVPTGWTIVTNTSNQIRVCNSADPIPVNTSRTIILKAQGVTVTPAQTFSGNLQFGTNCGAGPGVTGDLATDNSATSTIEVVAGAATISTTSIPNACNGQQSGQINATQTGLTGTLTWSLNPTVGVNNNNGTFQNLAGGTYTVSVSNGSASTSTVVTLTDPPVFSNTNSFVSPSCNNGTNGSITITSTGGTPYSGAPGPYIVELWQGTATSGTQINAAASAGVSSFSNLGAGQYFVRCKDFNACIDTIFNITLVNPTAILFTATATQINCAGGTGSAALVATGGTGVYTYLQGTTSVTSQVTGLVAGDYTFTATDANGCTASKTVTITQPIAVTVTAISTNVSCNSAANGTITAGGSIGATLTVNGAALANPYAAGTYTVVASAANGNGNGSCTASTVVTITQPAAINVSPVSQTNISCNGESNGAASVSVSGGAGGYTYNWTPGNPTGDGTTSVTGLTAGTWTCTATDANSCTKTQTFNITQPTAINVFPVSQTNISCNGGSNGAASVSVSGGAGGYTYNWTPGNPTGDGTTSVTGLTAGNWTCTATDVNSCTKTQTFTITQPTAINVSPVSQTNISCSGGSNGAASVSVSGGAGGYTYNWTPGNPTGDGTTSVTGLTAGNWTCIATDVNSCTKTQTFTITQPTAINVSPVSQTNISCNGGSNGAASLSVSGGAGGYTYNWTPGNPTGNGTTSVTGLTAGTWTCTATDANSCTQTQTFNITQHTAITLSAAATQPLCNGQTGSVAFTTSGGISPYTYKYGTTTIGNPATGIVPGTYTFTATDANGCIKTVTSIINAVPSAIVLNTLSYFDIYCNGGSTVIEVLATGGTGTLQYSIDNGATQTSNIITGVLAGTHTISIIDSNSCQHDTIITLTEPTALVATLTSSSNPLCFGDSSGTLVGMATGGTSFGGSYLYSWYYSGTPGQMYSFDSSVTKALAGTYTLVVEDLNGCMDSLNNVTLTNPTQIASTLSYFAISCNGGATIIEVLATGGTGTLQYSIDNGATQTSNIITGVLAGTYTISAIDINGCKVDSIVTITDPSLLVASAIAGTISCNSGTTNIVASANGGTPGYSYSLNGGAYSTNSSFTNITAGNYTINVKDANNCVQSIIINITEPLAVSISAIANNISCNGGSNGAGSVSVSGGAGGYTYNWTPGNPSGNGTTSVTGLTAGTWTCTVTDANGCNSSTSIITTQPTLPVSAIVSTSNAGCTSTFGSINVITSGGTGIITYTINGLTDTVNYPVGTYTILATDANGCTGTTAANIGSDGIPITIDANASVSAFCTGTLVTLWGSPDTSSSGTPLTFTWTGGIIDSTLFVYNGATTYTVIGTDGNCSATSLINISSTVTASQAIAQATVANATSVAGSSCNTSIQPDSSTVNFVNSSCGLIATVTDSAGGNALGNVSACVTVSANVMLAGNQPYVPRVFTITSQNQGPAQVTLYYTNDDFLAYNANSNGFPVFATGPTVSLANNYTMPVCITKYSALDSTTFSAPAIWDSVTQKWIVSFPVTSFSTFICHTCNPNNVPLGISYLTFNGRKKETTNVINWSTSKEENNDYFNLLRGPTPTSLTVLAAKIKTKAMDGNSATSLNYDFTDFSPLIGHNYYKLEQYDLNNHVTNSEVIDIYWSLDGTQVVVYPNPATTQLIIDVNIDKNSSAKMRIYDVTGKLVKQIETELTKGANYTSIYLGDMALGMYMIRISDGKGLNYSQQFNKQ